MSIIKGINKVLKGIKCKITKNRNNIILSIIIGLICSILFLVVILIVTLIIDIPITVIIIASIFFGVLNFIKALQNFSAK